MKKKIHPNYYNQAKVICTCGNSFFIGSTKPQISIEVCNRCHPLYTGEQKFIDTKGRIDLFQRRAVLAQQHKENLKKKKVKASDVKEIKAPKTLRELLSEL